MKLKIDSKNTKSTEIPISSSANKIEQIKFEFRNCTSSPEVCEAEVVDMWDELDDE